MKFWRNFVFSIVLGASAVALTSFGVAFGRPYTSKHTLHLLISGQIIYWGVVLGLAAYVYWVRTNPNPNKTKRVNRPMY